jgi:phosphatidate cytidylyltransferase
LLRHRLLSALIIISLSLCFVFLDAYLPIGQCHGFWVVPLGLYLIFGSALECTSLLRNSPFGPIDRPALIGCGGIMLASLIPLYWPLSGSPYPADCLLGELGWPMTAAVLALVGCFAWYLRDYQTGNNDFIRAVLAGWVAVYFGLCFAFWIALRMVGDSGWGLYLMVGTITITKFSDAGAYFAGRRFGKRKLCPNVSPGKTVEGLIGGMFVAALVSWLYFSVFAPLRFDGGQVKASWLGVIGLGVLLTLSGLVGDLLQSIFKREVFAKDSGRLLPGLGGLWDVTDSLLPTAAVAYVIIVANWIKGPGQL